MDTPRIDRRKTLLTIEFIDPTPEEHARNLPIVARELVRNFRAQKQAHVDRMIEAGTRKPEAA